MRADLGGGQPSCGEEVGGRLVRDGVGLKEAGTNLERRGRQIVALPVHTCDANPFVIIEKYESDSATVLARDVWELGT